MRGKIETHFRWDSALWSGGSQRTEERCVCKGVSTFCPTDCQKRLPTFTPFGLGIPFESSNRCALQGNRSRKPGHQFLIRSPPLQRRADTFWSVTGQQYLGTILIKFVFKTATKKFRLKILKLGNQIRLGVCQCDVELYWPVHRVYSSHYSMAD